MASKAEEIDVDGVAVRLTNRDKPYFPKLGSNGTKGKLFDYYLAVASGPMLTALRDRPTHLQRFPDGIEGEEIYQKRVPQKHPDYLETCEVTFPSGRTADALKVTHPSSIAWAAQMAPSRCTRGRCVVRTPSIPTSCALTWTPSRAPRLKRPARSRLTCSSHCSTSSV
jgi:hypothetical protein